MDPNMSRRASHEFHAYTNSQMQHDHGVRAVQGKSGSSPVQTRSRRLQPNVAILQPNVALGQGQDHDQCQSQVHGQGQGRGRAALGRTSSSDRALPSSEITAESAEEAYVQFVLYCNPSVEGTVSTEELRKGFRSPPRSDGKSFDTFKLFQLIKRLEERSLSTWTQLVIELGVEPPDAGQSTQKVQQYAVRLKRWLHAFHIDAFFQYCLGKSHQYFTNVLSTIEPQSEVVRDGVPPEDDLALRALLPGWRPKRGRRKADDVGKTEEAPAKKLQVDPPASAAAQNSDFSRFDEPLSAYQPSPFFVDMPNSSTSNADAWTAAHLAIAPGSSREEQPSISHDIASDAGGQQFRWRMGDIGMASPSAYPQSAITPRHHTPIGSQFDEPRSAHPQSALPFKRKKHGAAVSAAWPSNSSTSNGKLRGRPPSNRSVQDGPFSTFPVNPKAKDWPTSSASTISNNLVPSDSNAPDENGVVNNAAEAPDQHGDHHSHHPSSMPRKPSNLQLQVPEHEGAPVRLATPPRVLINGENDHSLAITHRDESLDDPEDALDALQDSLEDDEPEDRTRNGIEIVNWKRKALGLQKRLKAKEEELQALRRRVMEAVMR